MIIEKLTVELKPDILINSQSLLILNPTFQSITIQEKFDIAYLMKH